MAIDGASLTTVQDNNRPQNLDSGTRIKTPARENEMNQASRASEAGPAVVATFSAAALETSRATSEASQASDNSRMESRAEERYESRAEAQAEQPRPKIDVMA